MDNTNYGTPTENKSLEEKLTALEAKYELLAKNMEVLQSDKVELKQTVDNMNNNFNNVNKNIEAILAKLNTNETNQAAGKTKNMRDFMPGSSMSETVGKMMSGHLRKFAVGTISTIFYAADRITETTARMREGFEDMVAEAQYEHKKKQMNIEPDSGTSIA